MAKRNTEENYTDNDGMENTAQLGELDFNVEDEYKPDPLVPKGVYHGAVTNVSFVPAQSCILWDICLHDNGGVMNDGETPVDGNHVWFRNWLPKPGDESIPTPSGKTNKRQSKINMLKKFADTLGVNMSTPQNISTAISENEWVGMEVDVEIDIREYEGKFSNDVKAVRKSSMY